MWRPRHPLCLCGEVTCLVLDFGDLPANQSLPEGKQHSGRAVQPVRAGFTGASLCIYRALSLKRAGEGDWTYTVRIVF